MSTPSLRLADFSQLATSNWVIVGAIALTILAITTRIQSSAQFADQNGSNSDARNPPGVPYWLPIVGHIPNMIVDATDFLCRLRNSYTDGAYSLNFGGTTHNIIYSPSLVTALLNAKDHHASDEGVVDAIGERVFGFPIKAQRDVYQRARGPLRTCYSHLLSETGLRIMVVRTAKIVDNTICNLVSFSRSLVDQSSWERTAQCELAVDKNGNEVVAANLLDLIRDYCAAASNESIIGSDFANNFPNYLADLWVVDRAFLYLAAGLPRWTPIPMVTRAHIARRNLIRSLTDFEVAMDKKAAGEDPGPLWSELDDVGAIIQARVEQYRKYGVSMEGRAAFEFGLIWASNANSNMLVFWIVVRIFADKELLATLREEIAPYVRATQPKQELAVAEPPRLSTLDVDRLCTECPMLKSCYIECLRIDAGSWSFKAAKEDFVLRGRDKQGKAFLMKKGDFIHAAHGVHNSDPAYFQEPEVWKADRHIRVDEHGKRIADLGSIRPYGGGGSMCKGRFFAYKECMIFAAAIIAMWEIEPVNGRAWKVPRHRKATGVYGTSDPTRVHIRRRSVPVENM